MGQNKVSQKQRTVPSRFQADRGIKKWRGLKCRPLNVNFVNFKVSLGGLLGDGQCVLRAAECRSSSSCSPILDPQLHHKQMSSCSAIYCPLLLCMELYCRHLCISESDGLITDRVVRYCCQNHRSEIKISKGSIKNRII